MDKGMLELDPTLMKLDYCIGINEKLQNKIVEKTKEIIRLDVYIESPIKGEEPKNDNNIIRVFSKKNMGKWGWLGKCVWEFRLNQLPGCCGILILHHVNPNSYFSKNRRLELYKLILQIAEEIAKDNKYSIIFHSIEKFFDFNLANEVMNKSNWELIDSTFVKRTGYNTLTYKKEIKYD
jgi:hypothetical protein